MIIVDSSVWVDYFRSTQSLEVVWLEAQFSQQRVGLTDLILCEVLQGIRRDTVFHRVGGDLRQLDVLPCGGETIAVEAAQNYRWLQTNGITIRKTVDCLIATFCIEEGHSLLHRDRDFDPFEKHLGLHVIHPLIH